MTDVLDEDQDPQDTSEADRLPPAPRRALRRRLVLRGGRVVEISESPARETR